VRTSVSLKFTWFYQIVKMVMFVYVMYIAIRYGNIRLGRKKDKPEFSSPTYFCMTFVAMTGSGLLAYSASDPLFHRESHFFAQAGYRSQDEIDMFAVNMPAATWGVGAFVGVALVAVCMSLAGYRFNLPMTFRSCFYPILGAYTWGWMGDCIDSLSIIVMVTATCTMLATTAMQVLAGLVHLGLIGSDLNNNEASTFQNVTIWVITIASTVSVITGLRAGIQYTSIAGAATALVFTALLLLLDDTKFLLNLTVQEIGYFLQHSMVQLNFWTDAFGQLREGSGRAVDGKAAESWWME
jgi:choline/glycine/proline betaine transport protein